MFQYIKDVLLDLDIYGHPVSLNYKGSDMYKTWLGSACTMIVYLLVLNSCIVLGTAY